VGEGRAPSPWVGARDVEFVERGLPRTEMGWEIDASGLRDVLVRLHREYPPVPLYVTENGAAFPDERSNGRVHDPDRIAYLEAHFRAAEEAIAQGVDLRGYFVWTLMDNFEWAFGYTKRFGLFHVDYDTLQRTPKDSAHWFAQVTRRNGV
jgi:beta-glucosidase